MDTMGEIEGDEDGLAVVGEGNGNGRGDLMRAALKLRIPALRGVTTQGISQPREELDALPFEVQLSVPSGGTTAPLDGALVALPQRPFRGERLILTALYAPASGAPSNAADGVFITPAWYVGAVQVGASQGLMPFSAFGPTAFGVRLSVPPAGQGTRIYIPFRIMGNITAGDTMIISAVLIGRAVR